MIVFTNSNSFPDTLRGVYATDIHPPVSTNQSTMPSQQSTNEFFPKQVMGLVPVFPCCGTIDAIGGFRFGSSDVTGCNSATIILDINLGGVDLGTFSYDNTQSNNTIQQSIQAILPAGWICSVSGTPFQLTCTIYAPQGSGSQGNESLVITKQGNGCGGVYSSINVQGGKDNSSDCLDCDCREGEYKADSIPDDHEFVLPVFADLSCTDTYHNDVNQWVFQYASNYNPIANGDFHLQKLISGTYQDVATLNNNTLGIPFTTVGTCDLPLNYGGYQINWNLVLQNLGEGTYKFTVTGIARDKSSYCFKSPPFCLKQFECNATSGTVKFETNNSGGTFGSVTTQGLSWSFCCLDNNGNSSPLTYNDSIRFFGFFGYEAADFTRNEIKYATGEIKKIRDEAIKNFTLKSSQLPLWFHQRFYSYALMSDQLYVSDYNLNNSDYNLKHFWIVADSNYAPKYFGYTRYTKVLDIKFKEGQQFVFRDRCCGSNQTGIVILPGGIHIGGGILTSAGTGTGTNGTDREWNDLTQHHWDDGTIANWQ